MAFTFPGRNIVKNSYLLYLASIIAKFNKLTVKYPTESVTVTIQNRLVLLKKALPSLLAIAAAAAAAALRWSRCEM